MRLSELQERAGRNAREHGFWQAIDNLHEIDRGIAIRLALIASEVGEAVDAHRRGGVKGVQEELADIVIRCLDMAAYMDFDLEEVVLAKMAHNAGRPKMHGGKLY